MYVLVVNKNSTNIMEAHDSISLLNDAARPKYDGWQHATYYGSINFIYCSVFLRGRYAAAATSVSMHFMRTCD